MATLGSHRKLTQRAIDELMHDLPDNPAYKLLGRANLAGESVSRDILDALMFGLGHMGDFGQKHHFMRAFDGQSEYAAYEAGVEWVKSNALEAAQEMARRPAPPRGARGAPVGYYWARPLGDAVHALEDSFTPSHARRTPARGPFKPGAIDKVFRFGDKKEAEGKPEDWHKRGDEALWSGSNPTALGECAVNAVKHLIRMVVATAQAHCGGRPEELAGWREFRGLWLKAAPTLSRERDRVFDLIDRFYTGIRVGATNIKTLNMDEAGLAHALAEEVGTDTALALRVFEKLEDQYSSDSDDVAEIYVNIVRKRRGALEAALKSNRKLIQKLIDVMKSGWTSKGEKDCISYLKAL